MRRLVAAPDKFRGTATATEAAGSIAEGAARCGVEAVLRPMSDGGEGFVDVMGGEVRTATVHGPLGAPVRARWSWLADDTAVIESAEAAGRALLAAPSGDEPLRASTYGVGELLAAAVGAGARRIVVGCGGTSSSDGGRGCLDALGALDVTIPVPLLVACDVDVTFLEAATSFGPQKGATPDQVRELVARLDGLAADYRTRFGRDVRTVAGAGAGGGLAGALIALGATVVPGARFVADVVGLRDALDAAELVVTGEGALDGASLRGKVVGEVLATNPGLDALVVAGRVDRAAVDALRAARPGSVDVVELDDGAQRERGTPGSIADAVADYLEASA